MKILLDECVPRPLHKVLVDHECLTVQQRGWAGIKNGELLRLAEDEFDLFITADQGIHYQQNLTGYRISILQLSTNKLRPLMNAGSLFQAALINIQPGELHCLKIP